MPVKKRKLASSVKSSTQVDKKKNKKIKINGPPPPELSDDVWRFICTYLKPVDCARLAGMNFQLSQILSPDKWAAALFARHPLGVCLYIYIYSPIFYINIYDIYIPIYYFRFIYWSILYKRVTVRPIVLYTLMSFFVGYVITNLFLLSKLQPSLERQSLNHLSCFSSHPMPS